MNTVRVLTLAAAIAGIARPCTLVEGDRITGRDLAAAHARFKTVRDDLDFGPAPVVGTRRTFRPSELERIAREQGLEPGSDDSREACFERASLSLTPELLASVLEPVVAANAPGARIETVDFSRTRLPVGQMEFRWEGLASSGLWRGKLNYGDNRSTPIWARVRLTNSSTGEAIVKTPVAAVLEIARGETVLVEVTSGNVRLAFDAAAESSGHLGEAITVRNPANGQRFRAVVEAKGKAGIHK